MAAPPLGRSTCCGDGGPGLHEFLDGVVVAEEFECFLEAVEVVGADQDGCGSTVAGDDDTFVLAVHAIDEFGESVLHVTQRVSRHGHDCATRSQTAATRSDLGELMDRRRSGFDHAARFEATPEWPRRR